MPDKREAEQLIERLPDTYTKDRGSRLFRLFRVIGAEIAALKDTLAKTAESRDLDKAKGATLDHIGWENFRVPRASTTDAGYLLRIKASIAQYRSDGTVDAIIENLAFALNRQPQEIGIVSPGHESMDEPAALLIAIPFDLLAQSTLSGPELQALIENMVAAGVSAHIAFGIHGGTVQVISWPRTGSSPFAVSGHLYSGHIETPSTSGHLRKRNLEFNGKQVIGRAVYPQVSDYCGQIPYRVSSGKLMSAAAQAKGSRVIGLSLWPYSGRSYSGQVPHKVSAGALRKAKVQTNGFSTQGHSSWPHSGLYYCGEGW